MPTLEDIARAHGRLAADDSARLSRLIADWQIIADLSFSDLVLWIEDAGGKGLWAAAQIRPTTGPTTLHHDLVGSFIPRLLQSEEQQAAPDGTELELLTTPVSSSVGHIGWITRQSAKEAERRVSPLERAYRRTADDLLTMVSTGDFPLETDHSEVTDSLRVGDGFVRTDTAGNVIYASPNALSAFRRMGHAGDLAGKNFVDETARIMPTVTSEVGFADYFGPGESHGEIDGRSASIRFRIIPLVLEGQRHGNVILLRDVTELRLRERELVSKEATIREIHHRVKNNLQTVAALLRLQGRRSAHSETRVALAEAERRISSIALVHETLSQSFDDHVEFDQVADTLLRTILEVGGAHPVRGERIGSFGVLPGELATPLAMVLTELLQNAMEHAYADSGGTLRVKVERDGQFLGIEVADDGAGLPEGFDTSTSLGLSIVASLVQGELFGTLSFSSQDGTTVTIRCELP